MWDWVTFGVCVASVIPTLILLGLLVRYCVRHSDQRVRCFKSQNYSEDCEILVSTHTRAPTTREFLREFTATVVNQPPRRAPHQRTPSDPPPLYSISGEFHSNHANYAASPPPHYYGSDHGVATLSPPSYGHSTLNRHQLLLPSSSSLPTFNLNFIITSLDLLPEVAAIPPPPNYDEHRDHVRF